MEKDLSNERSFLILDFLKNSCIYKTNLPDFLKNSDLRSILVTCRKSWWMKIDALIY